MSLADDINGSIDSANWIDPSLSAADLNGGLLPADVLGYDPAVFYANNPVYTAASAAAPSSLNSIMGPIQNLLKGFNNAAAQVQSTLNNKAQPTGAYAAGSIPLVLLAVGAYFLFKRG